MINMKTQSNIPFPKEPQKYNEWQTVRFINIYEYVNSEGLTVYEADMIIDGEVPKIIIELKISNKFALLPNGEYIALNHALSTAKGYNLGDSTARCFPIVPTLAKVDIVTDAEGKETFSLACVALIDIEAQESYSDLLKGIELVDSYIPAEITVEELIVENLTTEQIDWEIDHLRFFNDGLKVVWLESESPSVEKEPILEELGSKLTIIVVDEN